MSDHAAEWDRLAAEKIRKTCRSFHCRHPAIAKKNQAQIK
jgi:hypothetical protein